MRQLKHFRENRGFSIVDAMIGLAVITTTALVVQQIFNLSQKSSVRSRALMTMLSLEHTLVNALDDEQVYQPIRTQLAAGTTSNLTFTVDGLTIARTGSTLQFDEDGNPCTTGARCIFKLDFALRSLGGSPPTYMAAYRITADLAQRKEAPLSPLGVQKTGSFPAALLPSDYTVPLNTSFYAPPVSNCDQANALTTKGIDPSTGQLTCWLRPSISCPEGSIAKQIRVAGDELQFDCVPLYHASCPAGYVLNWIKPDTLESINGNASETRNECVYYYKPKVPPVDMTPWATGPHVFKCPEGYTLTGPDCILSYPETRKATIQ